VFVHEFPLIVVLYEDHRRLQLGRDGMAFYRPGEVAVEGGDGNFAKHVHRQVAHDDLRIAERTEECPLALLARGGVAARCAVLELGELGSVEVVRTEASEIAL
jgi:hypothetical protein